MTGVKHIKILIITGLSGSGKSTAMAALEDRGFYCVDNMPVALLPKFLELPIEGVTEIAGLAFVMDIREKGFLLKYEDVFASLRKKGYQFEILFLEADENVLVQRYSQTRRYHPLSGEKGLLEGIRAEKLQLRKLRTEADRIINTSAYTVHELKKIIIDLAGKMKKSGHIHINVMSFGFKYGLPHEADLVADVRFMANPFFVAELQPLTGNDSEVRAFVLEKPETRRFLEKYFDMLDFLVPLYEKEGKSYLTIAVGCTGGRHRSVAIAAEIFAHLNAPSVNIGLTHRDIELG